jgi:hypothetical protein
MRKVSIVIASLFLQADSAVTIAAPQHTQTEIEGDINCKCVAKGRRWSQGEKLCINGTFRLCGMSQNIAAWLPVGAPCPVASGTTRVR